MQGAGVEGNRCPAHNLIFVTEARMPLTQRVVKRQFRRLLAKAGIRPVRLYDPRHTAATLGIAAGVSVKVISDLLGHASISFTLERYSHVLPSIQDEAAAKGGEAAGRVIHSNIHRDAIPLLGTQMTQRD